MTKTKSTKRALLMSGLALLMCVSMLIGSTFAWFTDSVASGRNIIQSGTLDAKLSFSTWNEATNTWGDYQEVTADTVVFGKDAKYEPGYTEVVKFKVENLGSLAFKYQLGMRVFKETPSTNVYGDEFYLSDYIKVGSMDAEFDGWSVDRVAAAEYATMDIEEATNLAVVHSPFGGFLPDCTLQPAGSFSNGVPQDIDEWAFVIHMPTTVGNEANHKTDVEAPSIEFAVNLIATQFTYESDSFGNQYDADATYPQIVAGTYNGGDTITLGNVSVTLPDAAEEDVYSLIVDNIMENTDFATGQTTLSLNIDLLKNGAKVSAEPGVTYAVNIYVDKNIDIIDVKHKGESISGFEYDINTGIVSFNTDSFSPFEIAYKTLMAKVGNNVYYTIDDAIANWTNGSTLTLLSDVTLTDVIALSSTEHHILDLGTYTMTAAKSKDAIQIVNNGRTSASYALDIKADATNPGGITATGKAIVRTTGKSGVKDRPIIRFYNGVFNASYIVYHTGSNGTNCPQFQFHGGEFNGTIYTNRTLNQFYGGTFNGSLMMSVDSSAYALVSGGTFKQLSNLYMSALNSDKFTIGSAKGNFNREVYVNDDGYYVVASTKPTDIEASVPNTPGTNDYLAYSKVKTEGKLDYTDVYVALKNNKSSKITVYVNELDLAGISFTGTIIVPEGNSLSIANAPEGLKVEGNVTYR